MKRKTIRRIFVVLLAFVVLLCTQIVGVAEDVADQDTLMISVTEITGIFNIKMISLSLDNQFDSTFSYGWAGNCQLIVETDRGTYSKSINSAGDHVLQGLNTITFNVFSCPGTVQKITLTKLLRLTDEGLPYSTFSGYREGTYFSNIVIYDAQQQISQVICSFNIDASANSSSPEHGDSSDLSSLESSIWSNLSPDTAFSASYEYIQQDDRSVHSTFGFLKNFTVIFVLLIIMVAVIQIIIFIHEYQRNHLARKPFTPHKRGTSSNLSGFAPPDDMVPPTHGLHKGTALYEREISTCGGTIKKRICEGAFDETAIQMRQMLEYMVEGIHRENGCVVWSENATNLLGKIDDLFRLGLITNQTQAHYHTIRQITNKGAHIDKNVTPKEIEQVSTILLEELPVYFGPDLWKSRHQ